MITLRSESAPPPSTHRQDSSHRRERPRSALQRILDYLPRGNLLDDAAWRRRHAIVKWLLLLHLPALYLFGLVQGYGWLTTSYVITVPAICLILGDQIPRRRIASLLVTAGLVYCSAALVGLSEGRIEAHFHFFIMIGFIALYQDWVPFLWNVLFTVLSHGLGSAFKTNLIFNHHAAQSEPWIWSLIHGGAVLFACVGVVMFWRNTEEEQNQTIALGRQLADADIARRRFTSELLVNLARRNQSMLYQQLDIINQLEEQERDPDALGELFRLDHLATRIRRNAESLLVLSGEEPPRVWSKPVRLVDVVRAAIAETEDLNRVTFLVDERLSVLGHSVTGLTHLLAELAENAVRFSPPQSNVAIRTGPDPTSSGGYMLTVEDWGVGMRPEDMSAANEILADPQDVDLSSSQRLGLHVVARLAQRHDIRVTLTPTAGSGVTAVVVLPPEVFATAARAPGPSPTVATAPARPPQLTQQLPPQLATATAATPPWATAPQRRMAPPPWAPQPEPAPVAGWSNGSVSNGSFSGNSGNPGWRGWWDDAADQHPEQPGSAGDAGTRPALPARAEPSGYPVGHGARVPAAEPPAVSLTRRQPQANLAPELRRAESAARGVAVPDAARARDALSRYQASRQAALGDDAGPEGSSGGGAGWR